jgi:hypothetical protein
MHEAGPGGTEAVVSRNTTAKRTTYEIKLPKASLGLAELNRWSDVRPRHGHQRR